MYKRQGYYLYKERIKLIVKSPAAAKVAKIILPAGEMKEDHNFGKQEVYHHDFNANIQLPAALKSKVTVDASYQGCSEKGLCYAPIKKSFTVDFAAISSSPTPIVAPATVSDNETDANTQVLKSGNLWLVIAGFFVAGLLLSLTPCVLPMIPILSSIIVGRDVYKRQPQYKVRSR